MPLRMNKMDIEVKVLITEDNAASFPDKESTEYDEIFRQPKEPGGNKYSDNILLEEIAQYRNKKFHKWVFNDDNNSLETDARIVISIEDWEEIKSTVGCYLKKGDIVLSIAGNTTNLIIDEVRPSGFLNGQNTLFILNLKDNAVPLGGII